MLTEQKLEVHILASEAEQAQIIEFEPQYFRLQDRLAICLEYEKHMHRNYGHYHSMFVAFDDQCRARVCMQNIRVSKDIKLISLKDFQTMLNVQEG